MNAAQKRAWLAVVTGTICVVGYLILIPLLGPKVAMAAFALFGINGLAPLIGRKESTDERDRIIQRRATLGGAMASYMIFVLGCVGTSLIAWAWLGKDQVPVYLLEAICLIGAITLVASHGAIVLALYRRHVEADNA